CLLANRAQIRSHLVREHLDQAETEQVRRIAAVRERADVAAVTGRAARPTMAVRAAVRKPCAERAHRRDVAGAVPIHARPHPFGDAELALEELPAAANRPGRIALDQVGRGSDGCRVALPGADLSAQRLRDTAARRRDT